MRRLVFAAALSAALIAPLSAGAALTLKGAYTTRISAPSPFKGTWVVSFIGYPKYTIKEDGKIVVHGHYATLGNQIQFNDDSGPRKCTQFGVYTITKRAKTISLKRISDPCTGRAVVLGHLLTLTS